MDGVSDLQFPAMIKRASLAVSKASLRPVRGELIEIRGPIVKIAFEAARIGQICEIETAKDTPNVLARVIAINGDNALVSPFTSCQGLAAGAHVFPRDTDIMVPIGDELLGRVIDGLGRPIDGLGAFPDTMPLVAARGQAPSALTRPLIKKPFVTGIRAIDGMTTLGHGQRIGIFGPPGTGKSSLLAAIAQHSEVDVIVIGMIGERGREVREFLERQLPKEQRQKVVVVVATSNRAPMERVYGAHVATAVAEGFRQDGKSVLLLLDSLTRVARALREVGLAAGEPPTRRGYPASVYPALPELIERAGRSEDGDITALYTVLVEGDGNADPIAEETRSLTDGHITLSQDIADAGRYPAIDVNKSLSRIMREIASPQHLQGNHELRRLTAKYAEIEVLLQVGEYKRGGDKVADRAILQMPKIQRFLAQQTDQKSDLDETITQMIELTK